MADKEIPALTAADPLDGTELAHVIQSGNSRKATLAEIAALAPKWQFLGGAYTSPGVWSKAADGDASQVLFTGLAGAFDIQIIARAVAKSSSGGINMEMSVNNGSSYYSSSGDYVIISTAGVETNVANIGMHATGTTAARTALAHIHGANLSGVIKRVSAPNREAGAVEGLFVASTSPIDAVRVFPSGGGNFNAGAIYCMVRK